MGRHSILTQDQISKINWLWEMGCAKKDIGKMFGVDRSTIAKVTPKKFEKNVLSAGQIDQIRTLRRSGMVLTDLAQKFGVKEAVIQRRTAGIIPAKIKRRPRGYPVAMGYTKSGL